METVGAGAVLANGFATSSCCLLVREEELGDGAFTSSEARARRLVGEAAFIMAIGEGQEKIQKRVLRDGMIVADPDVATRS